VDEVVYFSDADVPGTLTITQTLSGWQVAAGLEGTDTLSSVEVVVNAATGTRTLLVGNGGFATIQAAVDAADAGDTILIASGTWAGDVNVTQALTFVGQGADTVVEGMFNVTGTLAGALTFRNIAIDATGQDYGIRVSAASNGGSLALDGVEISNASINGLFYGHPSNSNFTNVASASEILDSISIVDSSFTNNGNANGAGRGGVNLFGFDGDLTVTGNTFTGGGFGKGFSVTGLGRPATPFDGGAFTYSSLGDVVFSNNTLDGSFGQDAFSFYYHAGFQSFAATGNTADAAAPWGLLNLDWVGGDLDLSTFFSSAVNTTPDAFLTTPQGDNNPNSITGTAFNDRIDARGGADTVNGGAGDDVIRVTTEAHHTVMDEVDGGDGADTLIFTSTTAGATLTLGAGVTGVETVALSPAGGTAGTNINAALASGVTAINGNRGANILTGGAGAQTISGGAGNDTMSGGAGDDTLLGSDGGDVAVYSDTVAGAAVTPTATGWQVVTTTEGTDTLESVHIVQHGGGRILLVGNGGFATIQAALSAAVDDDVIQVGPGTFAESLTINKRVTIIGSGNGTDPLVDTIIDPPGVLTGDGFWFGAGSFGSSLQNLRITDANNAIQIENNVGVGDLLFDGIAASGNGLYGINFRNGTIGDVTVRNSEFSENGGVGIRIPSTGTYGTLTVEDSTFVNNGTHGLVTLGATVAEVIVRDTSFQNNGTGGVTGQGDLILNTFSGNATVERVTFSGDGSGSNALQVTGVTLPPSGAEPGVRKAVAPIGTVVINDVEITGTYARDVVVVGRYTDLDGLTITDLDLTATTGPSWSQVNLFNVGGDVNLADYGLEAAGLRVSIATNNGVDFDSEPDYTTGATLTGGTGADRLVGFVLGDELVGGDGNDTLLGGDGNDTLEGGLGDDSIDGGAGIDRVVFGVTVTAADITSSGGAWSISGSLGEGADTITGVEIVEGAGGASFLLVGNGGFATLQAAIDFATAGDTILLAEGTYTGAVNINKAVTILGPNWGTAGDGMRDAEAILTGEVTVTASSGNVVISGVEFRYTGAVNTLGVMANVTGGANVTIEDSRFFTEAAQGGAASGRAIQLTTAATGAITIADNFFGGSVTDPEARFGTAALNRAIWSDGNASSLTITGNSFFNARTAMNLDGYDSAPVSTITGNTITNGGSGISLGTPSGTNITGITGNSFRYVGTDFNFQNVTTAMVFAQGTNVATAGVPADSALVLLRGTQGDALTGHAGIDIIEWRAGNDTLDGGDGDDVLVGGEGDDVLIAGIGAESTPAATATTRWTTATSPRASRSSSPCSVPMAARRPTTPSPASRTSSAAAATT
jgi:hypothetical protein